jgi:hypothetical protein
LTQSPSAVSSQARAVAILCMLVSGASGVSSVSGALDLSDRSNRAAETLSRGTPTADFLALISEAKTQAKGPDRQARTALLIVLAISLWFTFVAAGRVIRPGGLPREGIRRLLCVAAVVSAALRAVDGAADAAFWRRVAGIARRLAAQPGQAAPAEWLLQPTFMVGVSVSMTVLVAGSLAIIAQYFRSARVKAWAASQDQVPR